MIATFQKILTHKKNKIKQTQSHMDLMPNQVKAVQRSSESLIKDQQRWDRL